MAISIDPGHSTGLLAPMSGSRGFKIRALGEVAIRCNDIAPMVAFYRDILGLEHLGGNASSGIVFLKIADGFAGHTAVLALFAKDFQGRPGLHPHSPEPPVTGAQSSLHHVALSLTFEEQDAAMQWYDENGLEYRIEIFEWVGWRGVFTQDPEGNTVELVAFDESLRGKP